MPRRFMPAIWTCLLLAGVCFTHAAPDGPDSDFCYHYFKERRPLTLDASRVAVFVDGAGQIPTPDGEEFLLQTPDAMAIKGWHLAALQPDHQTSASVQVTVARLAQQGKADFTSPVFVGREGGPVIIT